MPEEPIVKPKKFLTKLGERVYAPFVKPEKFLYKMNLEKCFCCIVENQVVDPNKEDDYIRRELNGKLVFAHGICYKTWVKEQEQTD